MLEIGSDNCTILEMRLRKIKLLTQCHIISKSQSLALNLFCSQSILSLLEYDSFKYTDSLKNTSACVIRFDYINIPQYG